MIQARLEIDVVGPKVDIAIGRQVAALPALQFALPDFLEAYDGVGRKTRRIRAHEPRQSVRKITRGDAFQIKPGHSIDLVRRRYGGRIEEVKRIFDSSRSRTCGQRTATGPISV